MKLVIEFNTTEEIQGSKDQRIKYAQGRQYDKLSHIPKATAYLSSEYTSTRSSNPNIPIA